MKSAQLKKYLCRLSGRKYTSAQWLKLTPKERELCIRIPAASEATRKAQP
jgi:hypothetical protein